MYWFFRLLDPFPVPAKKSVTWMLVLAANALNDSFRSSSERSTLALYAAPLNNSGRLSGPYVVALASSGCSVKVHSVDTQSLCEWCIWEKYKLWLTPFPQSKQILIFCTYKNGHFTIVVTGVAIIWWRCWGRWSWSRIGIIPKLLGRLGTSRLI